MWENKTGPAPWGTGAHRAHTQPTPHTHVHRPSWAACQLMPRTRAHAHFHHRYPEGQPLSKQQRASGEQVLMCKHTHVYPRVRTASLRCRPVSGLQSPAGWASPQRPPAWLSSPTSRDCRVRVPPAATSAHEEPEGAVGRTGGRGRPAAAQSQEQESQRHSGALAHKVGAAGPPAPVAPSSHSRTPNPEPGAGRTPVLR